MGFVNKYPYTDMENLNLDWVIETINKVDKDLADIKEQCIEASLNAVRPELEATKQYVDAKVVELTNTVNNISNAFDAFKIEMNGRFTAFTTLIDNKIAAQQAQIDGFKNYIDSSIVSVNARTDARIAENNNYIFNVIEHDLLANLTIIDYFTGDQISVQNMLNKLAQLHITDSITYGEIFNRNKTYGDIAALGITYGDILMHGNTLIV